MADGAGAAGGWAGRMKYVLLVAAVGLALLLWPAGGQSRDSAAGETEEARLETLLSSMEGVGRTRVLLSERGAAVVCQGADSAVARLDIVEAVRCYTGLGADKIAIFKMNQSWRDEN